MINWQQIKQLEEDVGLEDLADVVVLFLSEVDEAIEDLPNKDISSPITMAEALHFLKGSAFNIGFQDFGDYCSKGEAMAHEGDTSEISVAKVQELYETSKKVFLSEVTNHCAIELALAS